MADTSIDINVRAILDVDQRTAETCLRIVEAYLNQHPFVEITVDKTPTGERRYNFIY